MGVISVSVNQSNDVAKLIEIVDAAIKSPKAWKDASVELKAAYETLEKANNVQQDISKLEALSIESEKRITEAEKAEAKAKEAQEAAKLAKAEAETAKAEQVEFAKTFEAEKAAFAIKETQLVKAQEAATTEIAKARSENEAAKAKQAELDELIAKYKTALANLQAASV